MDLSVAAQRHQNVAVAQVLRRGHQFRHRLAVLRSTARQHLTEGVRAVGGQSSGVKSGVDDLAHGFGCFPMRAVESTGCETGFGFGFQSGGRE